MEATVLLLLVTLCLTSGASFYGNSISFTAPKWNKNGTFTVGRTMFVFYNLLQQTSKQANKKISVLVILGPVTDALVMLGQSG